jgi:hypothetical protein
LIGFDYDDEVQDVHYVSSDAERVTLVRILNQRTDRKLAKDFPEADKDYGEEDD